ncbi:M23 family metallopeptidase [Actinomyces stomatis]|uniref:M23 family metallopeptidase n=1 Tax=Actinomyces stomatis TaxID=3050227 RepID=UPI002852B88A|nr:M23 family metallopeptidase [Actinomyces sp. PK606]
MGRETSGLIPEEGVTGRIPFDGQWLTEISPTRRVPSHGTDLFATTYALDFLAVDDDGRTAPKRSLRTVFATESPELFYAFGRPLYSPVAGTVVSAHDGEPDHEARRSMLTLIPHGLSQPRRIRRGLTAILGNHVIIQVTGSPYYVGLVDLQRGSVQVSPGERLRAGDQIGRCGNSGNSTQPHLHIQAMDSPDAYAAKGVPLRFEEFRQRSPQQDAPWEFRRQSCPEQGSIIAQP